MTQRGVRYRTVAGLAKRAGQTPSRASQRRAPRRRAVAQSRRRRRTSRARPRPTRPGGSRRRCPAPRRAREPSRRRRHPAPVRSSRRGPRPGRSPPPRPRRRATRRCGGPHGTARRDERGRRPRRSRSCSRRRPPRASGRGRRRCVATSPAITPSDASQRRDRPEQRRLVLLEVALVAERQALEQRQHRGQRPDHVGSAASDELGRVRIPLVRHHRAAGREGVGQPDEPESRVRPPGEVLREPAEMDHRQRRDRDRLDDEIPVADGVERVGGHAVEAELGGDRLAIDRIAGSRERAGTERADVRAPAGIRRAATRSRSSIST